MSKPIKLEEAKARLSRMGKTASDVARELGVNRDVVASVLSGRLRGDRGEAHKVAVALGVRDGVIVEEGTPLSEAMKAAAA